MLSMSVDTRAIERGLNSLAASQLPFAVALGINEVAGLIMAAEQSGLSRDLDRPTNFTKKGMFVSRATKRRLSGRVGFKPIQAEYLSLQASGGKRRAKRKAVVVPVNMRLNKYGNMTRGAIKKALAKPDVFSSTINGVGGIWKRPKAGKRRAGGSGTKGSVKGLTLLARYHDGVSYTPRLKFVPRSYTLARKEIAPAIARALDHAVKTAR